MDNAAEPVRQAAAPAGVARRVEELYTAHARLVRSVCRSLLRDRSEAEDAVQQTFLSAHRALANGSSPREPAAWLATIARNECVARVRDRMREPLPVDAEPTEVAADAHAAAVSRYEVATLREALADLPRMQREAILLRELRGLSYDEVARALSVTTGAVESLIFRARRTLQLKLGEAVPAFSPIAFLGRLLGSGGGDVVAPVAKVAAIGVGAALLAGGAVLGPHAFGIGHAVTKTQHRPPATHVQAAPPVIAAPSTPIWSPPASVPAATHHVEGDSSAAENGSSSDVADVARSDSSSADNTSADNSSADTSSSDTSNAGTSSSESENGGSGTAVAPATTPASKPSKGDGGDGSDGSGD